MNLLLKKANSNISGFGIFATRKINFGETICFMNGKEISLAECITLEKSGIEKEGDSLQIADDIYISLDEIFRCINHSCNPNAYICGKNELVALKTIQPNEEITYDYSLTMWEEENKIKNLSGKNLWQMKCNCGSENCRKIISQFYYLPEEIMLENIKLGHIQDFIIKKYKLSQKIKILVDIQTTKSNNC